MRVGSDGDAEVEQLIGSLDGLADSVDTAHPWLDSGDLDSRSVHDWLDADGPSAGARHVLERA